MNKIISKEIFIKNKIITPKYFSIKNSEYKKNIYKKYIKIKKLIFLLL